MRYKLATLVAIALLGVGVAACGSDDEPSAGQRQATVKSSEATGRMLGPNGEESTLASELQLTDADIEKLRAGNYTAAISWHEASSDFSQGSTKGMRERLDELGIELVAVGDAQFDAAKQGKDIESILARKPDALISIPVDPSAAAPYREAVRQGVKLAFISNVPAGFRYGKDYVGIGSSDQIRTGENTAQIMGEALQGEGKIGVIFHAARFFITNQRDAAFREALKRNYPNIEIVAEEGFEDPAKVEAIASAMLTRQPDLDGIYTTWAEPAEGVLAALRKAGRDDVKVVSVDLSQTLAIDMAKNGNTAGVSDDLVIDGGRMMADIVAYGLLGKRAPEFTVGPSNAVTRENLLDAWRTSYGEDAPKAVQDAFAGAS